MTTTKPTRPTQSPYYVLFDSRPDAVKYDSQRNQVKIGHTTSSLKTRLQILYAEQTKNEE